MGFFKRTLTPSVDAPSLETRASTYAALAELLGGTKTPGNRHIDVAADTPCAWVGHSPLPSPEIHAAAGRARQATSNAAAATTFLCERTALLGLSEEEGDTRPIPTCESAYLSSGPHADRLLLENLYASAGYYVTTQIREHGRCAGHVATELEFMSHLLAREAKGDRSAGATAAAFFTEHVARWVPTFADSLLEQADHEVLRLAAIALSQFVECEGAVFRKRSPAARATLH